MTGNLQNPSLSHFLWFLQLSSLFNLHFLPSLSFSVCYHSCAVVRVYNLRSKSPKTSFFTCTGLPDLESGLERRPHPLYFTRWCRHSPLPLFSSPPSFPCLLSRSFLFLPSCLSLCLEAADGLNGQSLDEVIVSLYHYILLLPFLVTEKPFRVGPRGTDWLSMESHAGARTHTYTPFNPALCPRSLSPLQFPQNFHDTVVLNGHSHIFLTDPPPWVTSSGQSSDTTWRRRFTKIR